jgi:type I restriction enzyme S subunit
VGKLGLLTRAAATNQAVCAIFLPPEVDTRFLFWYLRHRRTDLIALAIGGAQPNISQSILRNLEVPIPPLEDQRRIVAEIEKQFSRLDEAVANLKRVKANLKRYKAAVLKAAVEGRIVPTEAECSRATGNEFETGSELLQEIVGERQVHRTERGKKSDAASAIVTNLPELPAGWAWASVEEVGRLHLGRQRAPQYHTGPHMRPYLRVQNVFEDRIDLSDVKEMVFSPEDFERFELKPGDILLNEGQSPELLGRPAMYRGELSGACFTNTLIRFQAYRCVLGEFAMIVFRHYLHAGRFAKESNITTNIAHLSLGRLAAVEFPVPPLSEQQRIVAEVDHRLSIIHEVESGVDANLKRGQALRQATLSRAFTRTAEGGQ